MYHPLEVATNAERWVRGEPLAPMTPWYRGFNGTITPADARGTYTTYGEVEKSADGKSLHIKELPVKKWTAEYKAGILEPMPAAGEGKAVEKGAEKVEETSIRQKLIKQRQDASAAYKVEVDGRVGRDVADRPDAELSSTTVLSRGSPSATSSEGSAGCGVTR